MSSQVKRTSSDVTGSPSDHFRPLRIVKVMSLLLFSTLKSCTTLPFTPCTVRSGAFSSGSFNMTKMSAFQLAGQGASWYLPGLATGADVSAGAAVAASAEVGAGADVGGAGVDTPVQAASVDAD